MSGAEAALLGVGILCNAMQILTFAKDSIHVYRNIRDGQAPDPKLELYLSQAKASLDAMNQTAAQMGPLSKEQQRIIDVGKNVHDCVVELQEQFDKFHVMKASKRGLSGRMAALKKSALALWRGKELLDAEKNLQQHEQLLHGLLLDRVCSQSQAAEITSLESFKHLQGALQTIISHLVEGTAKVSDLVADLSSSLSDRLVQEHATTRTVVEEHATSAEDTFRQGICRSVNQLRQELREREQDRAFEKQHEQLLSSLRFPEMNSRKNHISSNYPGTFGWVFDRHGTQNSNHSSAPQIDQSHDDSQRFEDTDSRELDVCACPDDAGTTGKPDFDCFPGWLESDSSLFWISGKPASGKSSLMKFLAFSNTTVKHLNSRHSGVQILTHFFWKPGQLLQQNVEGMVLSLLYQALDGKPGRCRKLCQARPLVRHKRSHSDWSLDDLTEALIWTLKASSEFFCVFLDGLDEAKELEHLPWPKWTSSQAIHRLLQLENVKLCASSREEYSFCSFFKGASRLRLHRLNKRDIILFVRERLDIGLERRDRDGLIHQIVRKAQGVFLWVVLVVDRLNRAIRQRYATVGMLQERLQQTPSDLRALYNDMWGRVGDDGQLPSVRAAACRYFSLLIVCQDVSTYIATRYTLSCRWGFRMSSLLVIAIAAQASSMESILSMGRSVTVDELLDMCSKVENELKVASRGLLEITYPGKESMRTKFMGDARLCDYNYNEVNFIHRTAFDFLMDTVPIREIHDACGTSKIAQASRLLAAHLVRSRFIHFYRGIDLQWTFTDMFLHQSLSCDPYLIMALFIALNGYIPSDTASRRSWMNAVKEWQLSGFFGGHIYWFLPKCFYSNFNYLELELIEAIILVVFFAMDHKEANLVVRALLDNYATSVLIDSLPIVLRAFSQSWIASSSITEDSSASLPRYLLHRFQYADREKPLHDGVAHRAIQTLHSWYIIHCLQCIADVDSKMLSEGLSSLKLLGELRNTLMREDDWQHPVMFEFLEEPHPNPFTLMREPGRFLFDSHYALVIGNFATAYRWLDKFLSSFFSWNLNIHIPEGVISRFDIILIADMDYEDSLYYRPAVKLHNQIKALLYGHERAAPHVPWPDLLECPGSELVQLRGPEVCDYVNCVLEERYVEFISVFGIALLGDVSRPVNRTL